MSLNQSSQSRPFRTVTDYYQAKFGMKVIKIALNGGFTCPNRDGTLSTKGCLYCSEMGSGEFAGKPLDPLDVQFAKGKALMSIKWPNGKYIAYFQANTNTYGPVEKLRSLFESALVLDPNIVGLAIATRPDCLNDEILDLLTELNQKTYLSIELGLQTIHYETATLINRGHTLQQFELAVKQLRSRGIEVVVHIINGLPKETPAMMMETIQYLNRQDIQGIKIHMLYLLKNTEIAKLYRDHPFHLLTKEEYVFIVVDQIEHLRSDIIIHRLTGDAPRNQLLAPKWTLQKIVVNNEIDQELRRRQSNQGKRWQL